MSGRPVVQRIATTQCCGVTKSGRRCSITSTSAIIDALSGKLVAEPLKRGGNNCLCHAAYFCTRGVAVQDAVIVFLDLETSGLSIITDHIVEIGAVDEHGVAFSTVVKPPTMPSGHAVHGIEHSELQHCPVFATAFARLVRFLDTLAENAVTDDESSADEVAALPSIKTELPEIVVVAHNGIKFDFAMLLSECCRSALPLQQLARWKYVDTLEVAKAAGMFECVKLQCMHRVASGRGELRAHRALDDAIALQGVVKYVAESLGISILSLLQRFTCEVDLDASVAHLSCTL